ncbi:MAG: FAD-dependent oxidoreductase, partial [Candidatus Heimdallarchaeota archaeon]|nr:FAD-dependent oxidoreductase [Candidatus Heimdallarchaeota archaeon]
MRLFLLLTTCLLLNFHLSAQDVLVEAESFDNPGGWVVDPQFVQQMGSPYLMAHGMGVPVGNAKTEIKFEKSGLYHIWVRTQNWTPGLWEAPGRFQLKVNDSILEKKLGTRSGWGWQYAGDTKIKKGKTNLELIDQTGFNGRCDAIYFSTSMEEPPSSLKKLETWRKNITTESNMPKEMKTYDLVVVGGGLAGCAASIAAAEQGLSVALIHDRPFLGGNASQEIRVHTLGIYGHFERILKKIDT